MKIAGFDLATHTGVALVDLTGATGPVWAWELWRLTKTRMDGASLYVFECRLRDFLKRVRPDLVAYESVDFVMRMKNGNRTVTMDEAFRVASRLSGILMTSCEALAIRYEAVNVSTLKKFATGKGNASKDLMRKAARERLFGQTIPGPMPREITHDELDGLWTAAWAVEQFAGARVT